MSDIYQAPTSTESSQAQHLDFLRGKRKLWAWLKWISFSLMLLLPMNSIAASIISMQQVFAELSKSGKADPSELAAKISVSLLTALWAFIFAFPALVFWIFAIIRHRKWKKAA